MQFITRSILENQLMILFLISLFHYWNPYRVSQTSGESSQILVHGTNALRMELLILFKKNYICSYGKPQKIAPALTLFQEIISTLIQMWSRLPAYPVCLCFLSFFSRWRPECVNPDEGRPRATDGDRLGPNHVSGPLLHRSLPLHRLQHRGDGLRYGIGRSLQKRPLKKPPSKKQLQQDEKIDAEKNKKVNGNLKYHASFILNDDKKTPISML